MINSYGVCNLSFNRVRAVLIVGLFVLAGFSVAMAEEASNKAPKAGMPAPGTPDYVLHVFKAVCLAALPDLPTTTDPFKSLGFVAPPRSVPGVLVGPEKVAVRIVQAGQNGADGKPLPHMCIVRIPGDYARDIGADLSLDLQSRFQTLQSGIEGTDWHFKAGTLDGVTHTIAVTVGQSKKVGEFTATTIAKH